MTSATEFSFTAPNGQPITCLDDWRNHAGPKHVRQWKEGRSAMEVAKWWCRPSPRMPDDLRALLDINPVTRDAVLVSGTPEMRIEFDSAGASRATPTWPSLPMPRVAV